MVIEEEEEEEEIYMSVRRFAEENANNVGRLRKRKVQAAFAGTKLIKW